MRTLAIVSCVLAVFAVAVQAQDVKAPASQPEVKTPWFDAKVGDTLVYKMPNNIQQTYKVTKVEDKTATVQIVMQMEGKDISTTDQPMPRLAAPGPATDPTKTPGVELKELPNEVVKVSGQELNCKVVQSVMAVGDRKLTSKVWTCDKVPGSIVKTESDAMGANAVMMELVEFKRGG